MGAPPARPPPAGLTPTDLHGALWPVYAGRGWPLRRAMAGWLLVKRGVRITVGGGGVGMLGPCPVLTDGGDVLVLSDGRFHDEAECPATGTSVAAGQTLTWHSDSANQGLHSGGNGLPYSGYGAGGGWQICFA